MALTKKPFIGQLDRRISVYRRIEIQNEIGEQVSEEQLVFKAFAKLNDTSGGEELEGKILHRTERNYIVRFRQEILTENNELFVRDGIVNYEVLHVREIGRKSFLELKCVMYE